MRKATHMNGMWTESWKHSIAKLFLDLKGGTLNDSTDPLLTYSLQKYGVITDNLIPSLEEADSAAGGLWNPLDTGFKTDQLYQAPDINNHEFTGSVTFEAVWDNNNTYCKCGDGRQGISREYT